MARKTSDREEDPEVTWYRPPGLILEEEGKATLVLTLTCSSLDELMKAMAYELDAWSGSLARHKGCDGRLLFRINSTELPLDPAQRRQVEEFARVCSSRAREAGLKSPAGTPLTFRVDFKASKYG
jgi:hypothetical protein